MLPCSTSLCLTDPYFWLIEWVRGFCEHVLHLQTYFLSPWWSQKVCNLLYCVYFSLLTVVCIFSIRMLVVLFFRFHNESASSICAFSCRIVGMENRSADSVHCKPCGGPSMVESQWAGGYKHKLLYPVCEGYPQHFHNSFVCRSGKGSLSLCQNIECPSTSHNH
jgi:hypothetical protein